MLGNYEERYFSTKDPIWLGKYRNLSNVLHWHEECELIWIISGSAQIKIRDALYEAVEDQMFFCCSEDLHYIKSDPNAVIQVLIFRSDLSKDITSQYTLLSPKLNKTERLRNSIYEMEEIYRNRSTFRYAQLKNLAEAILIGIYSDEAIQPSEQNVHLQTEIISKIHREFAHITFRDMVQFSGYTPSHFSKKFKALTGMGFAQYLNYVKTEHAVFLLQSSPTPSITEICALCGFSTIRNFNRVFKEMTGHCPSALPKDFCMDVDIKAFKQKPFDPTECSSVQL